MRNILRHIAVLLQLLALAPVNTLLALGVTSYPANDCCAPGPAVPVEAAAPGADSTGDPCCAAETNEAHTPGHDSGGASCAAPEPSGHQPSAQDHSNQDHPDQDRSDSAHHCTCCAAALIVHPVFPTASALLASLPHSHYSPHLLPTFATAIDHPPCLL